MHAGHFHVLGLNDAQPVHAISFDHCCSPHHVHGNGGASANSRIDSPNCLSCPLFQVEREVFTARWGKICGAMHASGDFMSTRFTFASLGLSLALLAPAAAQGPGLSRVMREKLDHAKAILGAVVTSDWQTLDR